MTFGQRPGTDATAPDRFRAKQGSAGASRYVKIDDVMGTGDAIAHAARRSGVRRSARWRASLVAMALTLVGCGPTDDTTDFDVGGTATTAETGTFAVGEALWAGASTFRLVGGGEAELLSIRPLGLADSVSFEAYVSRVIDAGGELGLFPASAVPAEQRAAAKPLAHAKVSVSDGTFQAIVAFTVPPGGADIHGYRVAYVRDGTTRTFYLANSDHVCIPPATECPFHSPYP
jgi:hypothetical protein